MNLQLSTINWKKTILFGVLVIMATAVTIFLVIAGYALWLGFQVQGALDVNKLTVFAGQIGAWSGVVVAVMTFLFARLLARRVGNNNMNQNRSSYRHGLALGLVSAALGLAVNLITGHDGGMLAVEFVGTAVAGLLGGIVGKN